MKTIAERIFGNLKGSPETAVEYRGRAYSGDEIFGRVKARAEDLQAAGVGKDDVLVIIVSENLTAVEILLASWVVGASGYFVDFRTAPDRVHEWKDRLGASLIVGTRQLSGVEMRVQPVHPEPAQGDVALDSDPDSNSIWFSTSGTTGLPKFAPRTQARLAEIVANMEADQSIPHGSAVLSPTSVGYSSSGFLWVRFLAMQRKIVALDIIHRLEELDAALKQPEVVACSLPPSMIRRLAALPGDTPRYPNLIRLSSVGGPALPEDKVAASQRLTMKYRMTYSAAGLGLISEIDGPDVLERPSSCGKAPADVTITIRDGDRAVATGEIGEICVTRADRDEVRTGDIGLMDEDGYLYIKGRIQGYLSRNGVNFSGQEVANAALRLPIVEEAVVVAGPGPDGGDAVHLFVQATGLAQADLIRHLRSALPAAEQPDHVWIRRALPWTVSDKVDLGALKAEVMAMQPEVTDA